MNMVCPSPSEMRSAHHLVPGFGYMASEKWSLPARLLQLFFLSDEEMGVPIVPNEMKWLTEDVKLVVFSVTSTEVPFLPLLKLSHMVRSLEFRGKGQSAERVRNSFLGSHFTLINSSPLVVTYIFLSKI